MEIKIVKHDRFGEFRTVVIEGETWYVAHDVAKALGYRKPRNAFNVHVAAADKMVVTLEQGKAKFRAVLLNEKGVRALCAVGFSADANALAEWLLTGKEPAITPFVDKIGYVDKDNVAWFNAEFVARGLGFVEVMKDRAADSCGNSPTAIRWRTINGYLKEFGYQQEVGKDDYLPENMVYRLAMKANNETAVNFQIKIANEILPAIRKHGYYSVNPQEQPAPKKTRRPVPELAVVYAILFENNIVKIGVTADLTRRMKELQQETSLDILNWVASPYMTRDDALLLERALKYKFFADSLGGEFFSANFERIRNALVLSPADKLLAIAESLHDDDAKDKILIHAANLLVGNYLF